MSPSTSSGAWRRFRGKRWRAGIGIAVVCAASGLGWWVLSTSGTEHAAAYVPPYSACLLTDGDGLTSQTAAPVWAGMREASRASSMKVSFVQAFGPQDAAHVAAYANTLVQWRCDVIVAAPGVPAAAAARVAPAHPALHFVVVGAASTGPNVAPVPAGADVAASVKRTLAAAKAGHYAGWATGSAGAS